MVVKHGMDHKVGQRTYAPQAHPFLPNATDRTQAAEATAREIDLAVKGLVDRSFDRASEILRLRRTDLDEGVKLLLTKETLTVQDFPAIRSQDDRTVRRDAVTNHSSSSPSSLPSCNVERLS
jgi:cell division protease FtsH